MKHVQIDVLSFLLSSLLFSFPSLSLLPSLFPPSPSLSLSLFPKPFHEKKDGLSHDCRKDGDALSGCTQAHQQGIHTGKPAGAGQGPASQLHPHTHSLIRNTHSTAQTRNARKRHPFFDRQSPQLEVK